MQNLNEIIRFISDHYSTILFYLSLAVLLFVLLVIAFKIWEFFRIFFITQKDEAPRNFATDKEVKKYYKITTENEVKFRIIAIPALIAFVFAFAGFLVYKKIMVTGIVFTVSFLCMMFLLDRFTWYINNKFMVLDDIKSPLLRKISKPFLVSRGYYYLGRYKKWKVGIPLHERFTHILIVGPTDSKKTSSFIVPQLLLDASSGASAFVPDAKSPEMFEFLAGRWIKEGRRVILFDPWDSRCVGYNPIADARDDDELKTIVEVITREREDALKEEAFFKNRTKDFLFALIKLAKLYGPPYDNLVTVYQMVANFKKLEQFISTCKNEELREMLQDFLEMSSESKINTLTNVRGKLNMFLDPKVSQAFSRLDFSLDWLFDPDNPTLLIVGAPVDKIETGQQIVSLLANLVARRAFQSKQLESINMTKKKGMLFFYGDEGRILKITALADLVSIARYTRTQILMSFTDLGFLKYYREDEESIKTNMRTKIILRGISSKDARDISQAIGVTEKPEYRYIRGPVFRESQKQIVGFETKPALYPDEIEHIPENKALVFVKNTRPFYIERESIYNSRELNALILPPPSDIKALYQKWGINTAPLEIPRLERIPGTVFYRVSSLNKSVKSVSAVKKISGDSTTVTIESQIDDKETEEIDNEDNLEIDSEKHSSDDDYLPI